MENGADRVPVCGHHLEQRAGILHPAGEVGGEALGWKKSTTYTVLKRLCDRGIFQNQNGTVTALLSREEFQARQSEEFIADSFGGSLPAFLASFAARKKLSEEEIRQLQELIDQSRG